jgi:hypothetical protein
MVKAAGKMAALGTEFMVETSGRERAMMYKAKRAVTVVTIEMPTTTRLDQVEVAPKRGRLRVATSTTAFTPRAGTSARPKEEKVTGRNAGREEKGTLKAAGTRPARESSRMAAAMGSHRKVGKARPVPEQKVVESTADKSAMVSSKGRRGRGAEGSEGRRGRVYILHFLVKSSRNTR